eukprot:TRINITY_DN1018_c0_g1_i1.p1 TRINITY_DN1018_c0_g1~~TRINITY_DN1018_c0_g1_i1.p1  ORF type:complete len:2390 (-),score=189.70 TRINITY_DN1018_c0_g1_i1:5377-12546(-)
MMASDLRSTKPVPLSLQLKCQIPVYSPAGLSPSMNIPFVTSPQNFPSLIRSLSSSQVLQTLLDLLIKSENNSSLLLSANSCDDPLNKANDVFIKLITAALTLPKKDRKARKALIGILNAFVKKWIPKRHHYEAIYQKLASCLEEGETEGTMRALRILRIFCRENESEEEALVPNHFFFSPFAAGLTVTGPLKWEFGRGYTLIVWAKLEDLQTLQRSQQGQTPTLFQMRAGGRLIEYYFSGHKLFVKVDSGKEVEIATLLTNTWYCIEVSHTPTKQLKVIINKELKQILAEYPGKVTETETTQIKLCENFVGQLSSAILYKVSLQKEQLVEIAMKFPYGICSPAVYKDILSIPQNDICFAFSPISSHRDTVYDLHGGPLIGKLTGNSGTIRLPTPTFGPRLPISFSDILPILQLCQASKDLAVAQRLFHKLLLTVKLFTKYIAKYEKGTIKAAHEYKLLAEVLGFNLPNLPTDLASIESFEEIEEIVEVNKDTEKAITWMLFDTRLYWTSADPSVNERYWSLIKSKAHLFAGSEFKIFRQILETMRNASEKTNCCQQIVDETNRKHYPLNEKYGVISEYLYELIEGFSGETLLECTKEILNTMTQKNACHCLFAELLSMLNKTMDEHKECGKILKEMQKKLLEASEAHALETQIECLNLVKKVLSSEDILIEDLYKPIYRSIIRKANPYTSRLNKTEESKHVSNNPSENEFSERRPILESEPTDEEHNTSLLQERVLSEEANINSTIKKIKQIKIDIQETNKSNSKPQKHEEAPDSRVKKNLFFEEFELSGTGDIEPKISPQSTQGNHILSIEELVAQDPYKPPPAPKNEKMKQKRFFFGEPQEEVEVKKEKKPVVPKLQIPTLAVPAKPKEEMKRPVESEEYVPKKPRSFGLAFGKPNKLLAIDTDTINQEFDIGGEKGKKLVDEEEEAERFEQEVLELAEHCIMAMSRHSPSEQVLSKYATGNKGPFNCGLSVPITATHQSTLMKPQKFSLPFPQSTKERKQFTFCLDMMDAGAATPIKEESLMTSKSSIGRDTAHLEQTVPMNDTENCCALLVHELMGKPYRLGQGEGLAKVLNGLVKEEIQNCGTAPIILKVARKVPSLLMPVVEFLLGLCGNVQKNKEIMCGDWKVMKELLKLELELYAELTGATSNKANKIVEFEQVINFHSILITESIFDPDFVLEFEKVLLKFIVNTIHATTKAKLGPKIGCDCVKYLLGKALIEIKQASSSYEVARAGIVHFAEATLYLLTLTNELEKEAVLSFSPIEALSAPVVPYSDAELLKLLFELLAGLFWKSNDLQDLTASTISSSELASCMPTLFPNILSLHLEPLLQDLTETLHPIRHTSCPASLAFLTCLALKNAKGVTELEFWITEAEQLLKYFLLLFESTKFTEGFSASTLENSVLLLLGNLLQGCCEQINPDEHHQFYAKTLAHVFQYWFTLIRVPESKAKDFYEAQLISKDEKYLVPVEEIYLIEGVTIAELMRILTAEYPQLLEHNTGIVEQIEKVSKRYVEYLRGELVEGLTKQHKEIVEEKPEGEEKQQYETELMKNVIKQVGRARKWRKVQKQQKIWKNMDSTPSTLHPHQFENGMRCLLKQKKTTAIQPSTWIQEFVNKRPTYSKDLANFLFESIPEKIRKKLPPPMSVEASYNFKRFKGTLSVYKKHEPVLLLIKEDSGSENLFKKWKLVDIKQLCRKPSNGLEIILYGGRSVLILCETSDARDLLASKLVRLRGKWCKWLKYAGTLDPVKNFQKAKLTERWLAWEVPTLDYLLAINFYSGNSFNNAARYPALLYEPSVLPEEVEHVMGPTSVLQNEKTVRSRFEESVKEVEGCAFCQVLPTASLNTVPETYAIPYSLLQRENSLNLCKKHKMEQMESLEDYYKYILHLHEALEKNSVAPNTIVTNWIDRSFGISSSHKFFRSLHASRPSERPSTTLWDLMASPELKLLSEPLGEVTHIQHLLMDEGKSVFLALTADGGVYSVKAKGDSNITLFARYDPNIAPWTRKAQIANPPIHFLDRRKVQYIVQGGYLTGTLQLIPVLAADRPTISLHYHSATVTALGVDKEERIGISGTKDGECIVFSLGDEMFWNPKCTLNDHSAEITSIYISDEMQLFATSSLDGSINLYTLTYKPKLLRTFRLPTPLAVYSVVFIMLSVKQAILANYPLPCVVACCKGKLVTFSLNMEILAEAEVDVDHTAKPAVVKDSNFNSLIAYVKDGALVARKLPYLEERKVIDCEGAITRFEADVRQKGAVLALADGSLVYVSNNTDTKEYQVQLQLTTTLFPLSVSYTLCIYAYSKHPDCYYYIIKFNRVCNSQSQSPSAIRVSSAGLASFRMTAAFLLIFLVIGSIQCCAKSSSLLLLSFSTTSSNKTIAHLESLSHKQYTCSATYLL